MPVAVVAPNAAAAGASTDIFYIHADHLGTPRAVVDRAGRQRWLWTGEPFGASQPNTNPQGLGAFNFDLRFPGQYFDAESGLIYNHHRNFDPTLGRYVQSDPIGLTGGVNTYSYVGGNPISYVDPTGRAVGDWWDFPANLERARQIAVEEIARRPSSHNDMGDARRHSEWMRRTTQETNSCTAWMAGTGHELDSFRRGQPLNEMLMDLHNNSVGRDAGRNNLPVDPAKLWTLPLPGSTYNPYRGVR